MNTFRISLPEELRHPLVRHAAGAQARRVGRAQVGDGKYGTFARRSVSPLDRLEPCLMADGVLAAKQIRAVRCDLHLIPKSSDARSVSGTSATPFGVLESGIQMVLFSRSTWSFFIGANSL